MATRKSINKCIKMLIKILKQTIIKNTYLIIKKKIKITNLKKDYQLKM